MSNTRVCFTVSLPIETVVEIDKAAKESGLSRSAVIEAALASCNNNNNNISSLTLTLNSYSESDARKSKRDAKNTDYSAGFLDFWERYPRKTGKGAAWVSWQKQTPAIGDVLAALEWQCASRDWTKDGGAYVPMPATYLNQRRWEDEPMVQVSMYPDL